MYHKTLDQSLYWFYFLSPLRVQNVRTTHTIIHWGQIKVCTKRPPLFTTVFTPKTYQTFVQHKNTWLLIIYSDESIPIHSQFCITSYAIYTSCKGFLLFTRVQMTSWFILVFEITNKKLHYIQYLFDSIDNSIYL